jgi:7-carboxy-7-deazaguanine synthase
MKTVISQIITTIQGEGPSVGVPVILIRFAGCNLKCSWCDTKWAIDVPKCVLFTINDARKMIAPYEVNDNNLEDFLDSLIEQFKNKNDTLFGINNPTTILFTGGEPFLHTWLIDEIISWCFDDYKFEIETNGTLLNRNLKFIEECCNEIQLNISPKIDEYPERYTSKFLKELAYIQSIVKNVNIKIVYQEKAKDNILRFINKYIPINSQIVMSPMTPELSDKDFDKKFMESCHETVKFCIENNIRYSTREHVFLFKQDRMEKI